MDRPPLFTGYQIAVIAGVGATAALLLKLTSFLADRLKAAA